MPINLIWAESKNGIIGKDGHLPWSFSTDMKYFKEVTTGNTVVMGKNTANSLKGALPNRENLVLTHDSKVRDGFRKAKDIDEILELAVDNTVFVIGGKQVYDTFMIYADRIYLTKIDKNYEGDTLAPLYSKVDFILTEEVTVVEDDVNLSFRILDRIDW